MAAAHLFVARKQRGREQERAKDKNIQGMFLDTYFLQLDLAF